MNLNEIFRRFGEPVYNTPVAVVAELAGQNTGGQNSPIRRMSWQSQTARQYMISNLHHASNSASRGEWDGSGLSDYLESISISVIAD
jgi:hypothetical protein